ncbi:ATP-dependent endonuclease [Vibrio atlanticus]|uniref:ATP-dependent endonuclease n=1 Tax=Vibrio atlanticus TaxID=693153 RepID=UPI00354D446A
MIKSLEEYKADISDVVDRIKFDSDGNGNSENFEFQSGYGDWDLADVQKFNFLVGANNSGKSRVLRYILMHEVLSWDIDTELLPVKSVVDNLDDADVRDMRLQYTNDSSELIASIARVKAACPSLGVAKVAKEIAEQLNPNHMVQGHNVTAENIYKYIVMNKLPERELSFITNEFKLNFAESVYIPTLRTLRHISDDDLYHKRTVADYFKDGGIKQEDIFTGHDIAKDLKQHLLGTHKQREKVRHFEGFLSEKFFYGADISLTPRIDDNVVWFKEGVKDEYPIYDLGDGIQAIIILTYKVFMAEQPTVFFIEEPEKYLHAGMQRTLIEALADLPHHMFFMTTHSNHFLDLALERNDVATHQVSQHEGKTLTRSSAELTDLLDELGVRASSVLLANCSIWIEGVTPLWQDSCHC